MPLLPASAPAPAVEGSSDVTAGPLGRWAAEPPRADPAVIAVNQSWQGQRWPPSLCYAQARQLGRAVLGYLLFCGQRRDRWSVNDRSICLSIHLTFRKGAKVVVAAA
jgi:hypothetical protein